MATCCGLPIARMDRRLVTSRFTRLRRVVPWHRWSLLGGDKGESQSSGFGPLLTSVGLVNSLTGNSKAMTA